MTVNNIRSDKADDPRWRLLRLRLSIQIRVKSFNGKPQATAFRQSNDGQRSRLRLAVKRVPCGADRSSQHQSWRFGLRCRIAQLQKASARLRPLLPVITAVGCWLLAATVATAQCDDDDAPAAPAQAVAFEVPESQFDSWVFPNWQTVQAARAQLEKLLGLQIDDVERTGKLTESQRTKMFLAGQGDIKRLFEQVEVVRKKFLLVRKDQNKFNEIWQDIQPLQLTVAAGLFGNDSLFHKTLRKTLTAEQAARYRQTERDRRVFCYQAKVDLAVAILENAMPLRDEQRQQFIRLLLAETKPPRKSGQHDYYVIMWQAARLPEDKLKPLFDETQWKVLNQQFNQMRGMEQWLKQNGGLSLEEDTASEDVELQEGATKKE